MLLDTVCFIQGIVAFGYSPPFIYYILLLKVLCQVSHVVLALLSVSIIMFIVISETSKVATYPWLLGTHEYCSTVLRNGFWLIPLLIKSVYYYSSNLLRALHKL